MAGEQTPAATPTPSPSTSTTQTPAPNAGDEALLAAAGNESDDDGGDDNFDMSLFSAESAESSSPAPAEKNQSAETPAAPGVGETKPAAATPTPTPSPAAATPSPAAGTEPVTGAAPAASSAAQPATGQAAPAAAATATPQEAAARALESYQAWRKAAIEELATKSFVISDEEAALLATDPQKVLPRLGARIYLDAVEGAVHAIRNILPQAIRNEVESARVFSEKENRFYGAWKGVLDKEKHEAKILEIAQTWRQIHPNGDEDAFIRDVGAIAVMTLGLGPQALAAAGQTGNGHAAPASTPAPAAIAPHRPLGASPSQVGASSEPVNVFTDLALSPDD